VADLERANKRLEADNEALTTKVKAAAAAQEKARKASLFEKLGLRGDQKLHATFVTSLGDIHCTLRHEQTPETVLNFVELAKGSREWTDPRTDKKTSAPLYNGTIFHRVIPGFMIQGGDPLGTGTGGPGYRFADEIDPKHKFDKAGILAMANAGPNTNGSQFFVTVAPYPQLPTNYTIFGEVVDGLDVVKKIGKVKTGPNDRPVTPVVMKTVTIERVGS
jgi:peptidyl-prolyl cis-trans isomerase A (cyclophilin A)